MIDYAKLAIAGTLLFISFSTGWYVRNLDYKAYKQSVEIVAKTQEAKVESITKQHELVTKGIANEYEAKLTALRNYYRVTSVWNNPSSSKVSGLSTTPTVADVATAYNLLAGQCAATTQQLVSLQEWTNQQIGIK